MSILRDEEKIGYVLRSMYSKAGYVQYKMSKFEEYDFYAKNKDFLVSDAIITFTDTNGKLMALKPDVTLSIIKSSKLIDEPVYKVYYDENVYRISSLSHRFREIMQTGLECIGNVDDKCVNEVLGLAAASLKAISDNCILTIAHQGIISDMVTNLELAPSAEKRVFKCITDKNINGISDICIGQAAEKLKKLIATNGVPEAVIPVLKELGCDSKSVEQLEYLTEVLKEKGYGDMVRIDFSLVNDMAYYNGIVFKGYVSGIPFGVLSGGRYDGLVQKMGRKGGAIGFAVYLDMLEYLPEGTLRSDVEITEVRS